MSVPAGNPELIESLRAILDYFLRADKTGAVQHYETFAKRAQNFTNNHVEFEHCWLEHYIYIDAQPIGLFRSNAFKLFASWALVHGVKKPI